VGHKAGPCTATFKNPQTILEQFNIQHGDLQFTVNEETDNQIAYLDLNLVNKQGRLEMEIYRKPTAMDITMNNTSCHPKEYKLAAYKHRIHRLLMLPLNESSKRKELITVINIALNNGYKKNDILNLYNRLKYQKNNQGNNTKTEQKWVTFIYTGNCIRKITKLFKDTNLKVAFKTITAVGKLLSDTRTVNAYEQNSIYKVTCQSCHKVYIRQTG
jgi:hypothetical protein